MLVEEELLEEESLLVEEELLEEEERDEMMVIGPRALSLAHSARACRVASRGRLGINRLGFAFGMVPALSAVRTGRMPLRPHPGCDHWERV